MISVALSLTKEHQKQSPAHFLFLVVYVILRDREFLRDAFDFKKARRYLILNNLFFFFVPNPNKMTATIKAGHCDFWDTVG